MEDRETEEGFDDRSQGRTRIKTREDELTNHARRLDLGSGLGRGEERGNSPEDSTGKRETDPGRGQTKGEIRNQAPLREMGSGCEMEREKKGPDSVETSGKPGRETQGSEGLDRSRRREDSTI
jgi:hypothetical protein